MWFYAKSPETLNKSTSQDRLFYYVCMAKGGRECLRMSYGQPKLTYGQTYDCCQEHVSHILKAMHLRYNKKRWGGGILWCVRFLLTTWNSILTQSSHVVVCVHLSSPSTSLTALLLQFIDPPQYVSQVGIVFFVDGEGEIPQSQRFRPVFVNGCDWGPRVDGQCYELKSPSYLMTMHPLTRAW